MCAKCDYDTSLGAEYTYCPYSTTIVSPSIASPRTIYYTLLYHGNCIDGWFSAYIARQYLATKPDVNIQMFPIGPDMTHTFPSIDKIVGTHMYLLDVSLPENVRSEWLSKGVNTISCIDHHESAIAHWTSDDCPIDTESCAAIQTFRHFFPSAPVPEWLNIIDRIDRWYNLSHQDLCIRELLLTIASKSAGFINDDGTLSNALYKTHEFITTFESGQYTALISQGYSLYAPKTYQLQTLIYTGSLFTLTEELCRLWNLPHLWIAKTVFVMDTTDVIIDSSLASYVVFNQYPADVFINYRKKHFRGSHNVIYSVRLNMTKTPFSIIQDTLFKGHPSSAGGVFTLSTQYSPFPFEIRQL
jgi:hypothetical protein